MLEVVTEVGRGLFAALFAVAAGSKMRPRAFGDLSVSLAAYGMTSKVLSRLAAATLIVAEATVTAVLILGPASAGLGLAALLLVVLAGGVLVSTRRQLNVRCACFGTAGETLNRGHLWRNTTLAALALILALAVLPCEVGDAAGGWLALQRGVSAVVIVGVQPAGEGVASFLL